MRALELVCVVCLVLIVPLAQGTSPPQVGVLRAAGGDVKITPIHHASLMLEWCDRVIHVDPWSETDYSILPRADLILITDTHGDRLDLKVPFC